MTAAVVVATLLPSFGSFTASPESATKISLYAPAAANPGTVSSTVPEIAPGARGSMLRLGSPLASSGTSSLESTPSRERKNCPANAPVATFPRLVTCTDALNLPVGATVTAVAETVATRSASLGSAGRVGTVISADAVAVVLFNSLDSATTLSGSATTIRRYVPGVALVGSGTLRGIVADPFAARPRVSVPMKIVCNSTSPAPTTPSALRYTRTSNPGVCTAEALRTVMFATTGLPGVTVCAEAEISARRSGRATISDAEVVMAVLSASLLSLRTDPESATAAR